MTVTLDLTRKAISIAWDTTVATGGTVDIKAENPATGDVSTRDGLVNDGLAVYTFPRDYSGTAHFTVTGSDGGVDEGDITV
jgi:hypothetical protein